MYKYIYRRMGQIYVAIASLIVILAITIADVFVVGGIFYETQRWELISWWHRSMWMMAVMMTTALVIVSQNLLPIAIIFIPLTFQIEDLLYMYIGSTLNLHDWSWTNLSYEWPWLDGSVSHYIAKLLGYTHATTQTIIISSSIGTTLMTIIVLIQIYTLKLCIGKICKTI